MFFISSRQYFLLYCALKLPLKTFYRFSVLYQITDQEKIMEDYIFEGELYNNHQKLTIRDNDDGYFLIYWDALLLGQIWLELNDETEYCEWRSDDVYLQGCLTQLGEFIEQIKAEED